MFDTNSDDNIGQRIDVLCLPFMIRQRAAEQQCCVSSIDLILFVFGDILKYTFGHSRLLYTSLAASLRRGRIRAWVWDGVIPL